MDWINCSEDIRGGIIIVFFNIMSYYILLWIKKVRVKDKTYIWGSVWWKTQKFKLRNPTPHIHWVTPLLLSYTLRYVSFAEVDRVYRVVFREPIHLCTCVSEEGGDGEAARSETPSLLPCTLRYVSFAEVGSVCRVALREPMHLSSSRFFFIFFLLFWGRGMMFWFTSVTVQ